MPLIIFSTTTLAFAFFLLRLTRSTLAAPIKSNHSLTLGSSCAPGGNFDLSPWTLQLPTGSPDKPNKISSSKLDGTSGYTSKYFSTSSKDGSLVMKVPGSPSSANCVTTPNSRHCRTELREYKPKSWDPSSPINRLKVRLSVPKPDESKYGTVIGQIHVDDKVSSKPVCELFNSEEGVLRMGVSQIPGKSSLKMMEIGKVDVGEVFEYEIRYEKGKLKVAINGEEWKVFGTGELDGPSSYFKVGNCNQGDSESEV